MSSLLSDPRVDRRDSTSFASLARHLCGVLALTTAGGCFDAFGTFDSAVAAAGGGSDRDLTGPSTTGGGGASVEDCSNGIDDDGDELADCEDSGDCGGYTCMPLPAQVAGWGGPTLLSRTNDPPSCGGAFPAPGPSGKLSVETCACNCANPTGETCSVAFSAFSDDACANVAGQAALPGSGACTSILGSPTAASYRATAAPAGGSCIASVTGGPSATDPVVTTCLGGRGGGCEAGFYCGRPPSPTQARICFTHPGDVACPDAVYDLREVLYPETGAAPSCDDTPCSCGGAVGGACTGGTVSYGAGSCSTPEPAPTGACTPIAAQTISSAAYTGAAVSTPGNCAPSPSLPVGALPPTVTTVCCAPPF